ncbi:MAG: polysaccharide deacetylase family protein [Oscillospiraceae bacterium]|nr:polysaccharide deacetylase family protein [Oscillospiraceae bacterium]
MNSKSKTFMYILILALLVTLTACSGASDRDESTRPAYRTSRQIDDVLGVDVDENTPTQPPLTTATSAPSTENPSPEETKPAPFEPSEIIVASPVPRTPDNLIDPTRPMVALTFDDGPSVHTEKIMKLLDENNGRGTFFVIAGADGNRLPANSTIIRTLHEGGHDVFGHSLNHKNYTGLSAEQLRREIVEPHDAIEDIIGAPVSRIFRPPFGMQNDTVRQVAFNEKFAIVNWSVDTRDWSSRNADAVYNAVMKSVRDRDVILSHDIHASTAEAMIRVIPELVAQGYQLVTLSELYQHSPQTLEPGKVYFNAR